MGWFPVGTSYLGVFLFCMKKIFFLIGITVGLASCSDSNLDCVVEGYESCNLKGNVEEVISVTYWASAEKDCEPVRCSNAWKAGYWKFDENGHCTKVVEWEIPYENCKESSYVVWNADGKPLEYIHWDMDRLSTKISHLKYTYNFDGVLTDTHDEMYDWLLSRRSKPVSVADMKNDLTGYQYAVSLGDTIGAIKFNESTGVSEFIHYAHWDGNKYELKYAVKCVESRNTVYEDGKAIKSTFKDGDTESVEYDGMQIAKVEYKNKQGFTITEFENGYATVAKAYDSGNNVVSTTEFSYSGNIRENGSYKSITKDQSGKESTAEFFYKNGKVIKEIMHRDSTMTTNITYNDNGDLLCVDSGNDSKEYRKYEYDAKGNWVVCRTFDAKDEPLTVIKRIIKYRK